MQATGQTQAAQPPKPAAPKAARPKPVPPPEFQAASIEKLPEADLIALLKNSSATTFQKAKACQRLASVGTESAVPALAALLGHPELSTYARYGLQPIPGPAADDALRGALPKSKGVILVGIINSTGYRKDAKAAPALSKLLYSTDAAVAQASAAALGHIGTPESAKTLQAALARTKGSVRAAVADGCLICAEELLAKGDRAQAFALYNAVMAPTVPKPARLAAMHGTVAAEISLSRPRVTPPGK
jgi:HEAT repeat protein